MLFKRRKKEMNATQPAQPSPDPDGDNPLQFWVAYIPGEGNKKNYLSDGKGNLRIFKSEEALRKWLQPQLRQEVYEMVVVHPVQGKIALPDDGTLAVAPPPLVMPNLKPMTTLAAPSLPTVQELLDSHVKRRRRRRH